MTDLEPIQRGAFLAELRRAATTHTFWKPARDESILDRFIRQLDARLAKGAQDYGDTSPQKPYGVLLGEMEQELLDIAGWSCQAWRKVNASVRDDETLHAQHPKALLAQQLLDEALSAFWTFVQWQGRLAKLCKELDERRV